MTDPKTTDDGGRDIARVTIETPLPAEALVALCRDAERMLRINPLMEFEALIREGDSTYLLKALNLSNDKPVDTRFTTRNLPNGLILSYESGIKNTTTFSVEPVDDGARANLVVTDDYSNTPEAERRQRIDEVDHSLVPWGGSLGRYFRHWDKWSGFGPWRWYVEGPWQNMKPSARRISNLIVMITVVEFVMFLMVFAVFWLELDRYLKI